MKSTKATFTSLLVALLVTTLVAAPAAALVAEETVTVDEDTHSIYVTADNASSDLLVDVIGVEDDGTETTVVTNVSFTELDTSTESTDSEYQFEDVNASKFDEYRVEIHNGTADNTSITTLQETAASGGAAGVSDADQRTLLAIIGVSALAVVGFLAVTRTEYGSFDDMY